MGQIHFRVNMARVGFPRIFFGLRRGVPLYPDILQYYTMILQRPGSLWEMPDWNLGPLEVCCATQNSVCFLVDTAWGERRTEQSFVKNTELFRSISSMVSQEGGGGGVGRGRGGHA